MTGAPPPTGLPEWARGRAATVWTPLAWGFAEASFFLVIPDVAVGFAALWGLRGGLRAAGWAVVGAVAGGTLVFLWPVAWQAFFPHLFGISGAMVADAAARFDADGWWAMVSAPGHGLPYKLFAAEAALDGRGVAAFWFWTVVARAWRFLLVALLAAGAGRLLRRWTEARPLPWSLTYLGFWVLVYVQYYVSVSQRYGL